MTDFQGLGQQVADAAAAKMAQIYNAPDYTNSQEDYTASDFAQYFDDLPDLFGAYDGAPNPAAFDYAIGHALDVVEALSFGDPPKEAKGISVWGNPDLDEFENVDSYVDNWDGQAAESFHEQFLIHTDTYTRNQGLMALAIHNALTCEQELWKNTLKSLQSIGDGALDAIDDCQVGGGEVSLSTVIGVVGTVVGAATGGTVAILSAAIGIFAAATEVKSTGHTPLDIAGTVRDRIEELKKDTTDEEDKLQKNLKANLGALHHRRDAFVAKHGAWRAENLPSDLANTDDGLGGVRGDY